VWLFPIRARHHVDDGKAWWHLGIFTEPPASPHIIYPIDSTVYTNTDSSPSSLGSILYLIPIVNNTHTTGPACDEHVYVESCNNLPLNDITDALLQDTSLPGPRLRPPSVFFLLATLLSLVLACSATATHANLRRCGENGGKSER
jgi:hypothetical protein